MLDAYDARGRVPAHLQAPPFLPSPTLSPNLNPNPNPEPEP